MNDAAMLNRTLESFEPGQRVLVNSEVLGEYIGWVARVDSKGWPTPITVSSEHGMRDHGPFRLTILPADSSPAAIEEWLDK